MLLFSNTNVISDFILFFGPVLCHTSSLNLVFTKFKEHKSLILEWQKYFTMTWKLSRFDPFNEYLFWLPGTLKPLCNYLVERIFAEARTNSLWWWRGADCLFYLTSTKVELMILNDKWNTLLSVTKNVQTTIQKRKPVRIFMKAKAHDMAYKSRLS